MNKCIACGLDFKSVGGFNLHMVFKEKENHCTRRCLTEQELRDKGFEPDDYGRWRIPMTEEQKEYRFGRRCAKN